MVVHNAVAMIGGGVTMVLVGQLNALAGSNCTILCNPPIALVFGAVAGLLSFGRGAR
jgi:hypothetical protein